MIRLMYASRAMNWPGIETVAVRTNGIRLRCVVAGEGPLVVLLHGFPQTWRCWEHQIGPLAERFRVVVPELRGHGESDRPEKGYELGVLADDVRGLIEHFVGKGAARIVGHDWGGIVGWVMAYRHPARVDRLAIINAPHPAVFARRAFRPPQLYRNWPIWLFQIPWLPEFVLRVGRGWAVEQILRAGAARPEAWSRESLQAAREAMLTPGAAAAALALYRNVIRRGARQARPWSVPLEVPAMVMWGDQDPALAPTLLDGMERYVLSLRLERFVDGGHWLQHEQPERVTGLLMEWLSPAQLPRNTQDADEFEIDEF